MASEIREPIQVYLTATERTELDRLAGALGVSRSEVLRRGVSSLMSGTLGAGPLQELVAAGVLTVAQNPLTVPPHSAPVAPLAAILDELDGDRNDR